MARRLRLILAQTLCPHCRTQAPAAEDRECPACGRELLDAGGERLRPIDLDYPALLARLDARALRRTLEGTGFALAVALSAFLITPPVAGLVLFFAQLLWVRILVAAPFRRHYTGPRRIITRWLSRVALVLLAGLHAAAALPLFQLAAAPALFFGICALAWGYHRWHLGREHERLPVHPLEKVILAFAVLALLTVLALGALIAAGISALAAR